MRETIRHVHRLAYIILLESISLASSIYLDPAKQICLRDAGFAGSNYLLALKTWCFLVVGCCMGWGCARSCVMWHFGEWVVSHVWEYVLYNDSIQIAFCIAEDGGDFMYFTDVFFVWIGTFYIKKKLWKNRNIKEGSFILFFVFVWKKVSFSWSPECSATNLRVWFSSVENRQVIDVCKIK